MSAIEEEMKNGNQYLAGGVNGGVMAWRNNNPIRK
jgi:hypothetical protein